MKQHRVKPPAAPREKRAVTSVNLSLATLRRIADIQAREKRPRSRVIEALVEEALTARQQEHNHG